MVSIYPLLKCITAFGYRIDYLAGASIYASSILYLLVAIAAKYLKAKRSSRAILPSFYFLNLIGVISLYVNGSGDRVFGLFMFLNAGVYLLLSLFLYNGKYTQPFVLWFISGLAFVMSNFDHYRFACVYLLVGLMAYLMAHLTGRLWRYWSKFPEEELVNWISDLRISLKAVTIFSYLLSFLVAMVLTNSGSLMIVLFLFIFVVLLLYRRDQITYFIPALFLYFCLGIKVYSYLDLSTIWKNPLILIGGLIFYVLYLLHDKVEKELKEFKNFRNVYLLVSILSLIWVYFSALLNFQRFGKVMFGLQMYMVGVVVVTFMLHSVKSKSIWYKVFSAMLVVFMLFRIGRSHWNIENAQYYLIIVGLFFHYLNRIFEKMKFKLAEINLFTIVGILSILGVSIIQSLNNAWYLIWLVFEGLLYLIILPLVKKRYLGVFVLILVGLGVVLNSIQFIMSFPQWLSLASSGIIILVIAVGFLFFRKTE